MERGGAGGAKSMKVGEAAPVERLPSLHQGGRQGERQGREEAMNALLDFLIMAHQAGERLFEGRLNTHADWILIKLLLQNGALGRATVAKDVKEHIGLAPGTVRAMLKRFADSGYITTQQYIGRSELFQPTPKLLDFLRRWAAQMEPRWDAKGGAAK